MEKSKREMEKSRREMEKRKRVERLLEYKKRRTRITRSDLSDLLGIPESNTRELYEAVEELLQEGALSPMKNADWNGNRIYPLASKYSITLTPEKGQEEQEALSQIQRLYPRLQDYLSSHPDSYLAHKEVIDRLSSFLFSRLGAGALIEVSRKERSYEIFGREKILDDSSVKSLLKKLGLSDRDLGFYDTPEYCFHDYIPVRSKHLSLLILENKDIWFNIRRCMFEDHYQRLFGVPLDGVVYGEGNRVSMGRGKGASPGQGALTEYVRFMGSPKVTFLYWGDIDREGFDIYLRTRKVNPGLDISLFLPGYEKMLERARGTQLEDSPSSRNVLSTSPPGSEIDFLPILSEFPLESQSFLRQVLGENKLIPQEIIPYTVLSES